VSPAPRCYAATNLAVQEDPTCPSTQVPGAAPQRARSSTYPRSSPPTTPTLPIRATPAQRVAFGTSGHRGSSLRRSFNDAHIAAISRAVIEYRQAQGVHGPLVLGADTHALSEPAFRTALEVLVAGGVTVVVQDDLSPVPTPVVSHAILRRNGGRTGPARAAHLRARGGATASSSRPRTTRPTTAASSTTRRTAGPADTDATSWIERRANELLGDVSGVPGPPSTGRSPR
jgi:phosphoglucomutase